MDQIGFGGGCHWCTEAVFQSLRGVGEVRQGFIASDAPDETFSEAVLIDFDPDQITLSDLIEVHLITHASTADHKMRGKYRSGIYVVDQQQGTDASALLSKLTDETGERFVTRVLPMRAFKASDERFHDYYASNPDRPFCQTYINPKLAKLRQKLPGLMKKVEEDAIG